VAGAVLLAGLTYLVVPSSKYTAQALLKVDPAQKWMFNTGEPPIPFATYIQNQVTLARSRHVLQTALTQPQVAALASVRGQRNPAEWLEKELAVDSPSAGSEFLRIGLSGDNADELAVLVKAITLAYLKEVDDRERGQRRDRRDQLQAIYNGYEKSLEAKRLEIKRLRDSVGSENAQTLVLKHRYAEEAAGMAQKELLQVQSDLRNGEIDLENQRARMKTVSDVRVPESVLDESVKKDPQVDIYVRERAKLLAQIEETRRIYKPGWEGPHIRQYQQQLDTIARSMTVLRNQLRPEVEAQYREKTRQEAAERVEQLQEKVAKLQKLEKSLQAQTERLVGETRFIEKSSLDLETKQTAIAKEESIARKVGEEVETLNVELQAPPRVSLVEDAAVTHSKDDKRPLKMAGLAAFGTLGLILLGFSWWECQARRIHSADEVSLGLGLKVLGTLPTANPADPAPLAEACDAARAVLLHTAKSEGLRSLLVTSAVSGEGKTSLATQLVASLGRAGLQAVLVDADLRNPSAHTAFGMPLQPGLSEALRGEAGVMGLVRAAPVENVWLLAAGNSDSRAIQALSGERLRGILDSLKGQFDFVVIDSCPILPVADSLAVGQHADAVLITVLCDVSQVRKVYTACQRLALFGVRLLGAVVNGVQEDLSGTVYRYIRGSRGPG
jgi:capsular exopolysaccharide synthesis family protein